MHNVELRPQDEANFDIPYEEQILTDCHDGADEETGIIASARTKGSIAIDLRSMLKNTFVGSFMCSRTHAWTLLILSAT